MVQEFLSLLTVLVFAVLAALVRIYVPLTIAALNRKAEAVLGAANRDALYAAVKVGLNAASKHGLDGEALVQKAIQVASMYLNQHRIPVSTALLNEAIQAEQQKRQDRKTEFGVLTLSEPETEPAPSPTTNPWQPEIDMYQELWKQGWEELKREIKKDLDEIQNNNDNDKPR